MRARYGFLERRVGRRGPAVVDSVLALSYIGVGLLLGQEDPPAGWHRLDAWGVALTIGVSLTLLAGRRAPVAAFACSDGLWILYIACGYWPVVNSMAPLMGLYRVASARRPRTTAAVTERDSWRLSALLGDWAR
ncbi:hypothetical protein J7E97_07605 [Streptomyces sp. ISL-66]|uniref:hypothetical protein n=1 Tax=Streptomyces sp. ISL-66 TaxID=2819186 RepID=UPI001BEC65F7|nr:hypothetical protein [Streptomyces sp. ISL-66]MBT2467738.1 hypothetical protein [Streptomyces sp. ISL-66]